MSKHRSEDYMPRAFMPEQLKELALVKYQQLNIILITMLV